MPESISTFFTEFITKLALAIYNGILHWLQDWLDVYNMTTLSTLQDAGNTILSGINSSEVSSVLTWVEVISQNVFIPIASILLAFFFCWQLISMLQEGNQFQMIRAETLLFFMLKLGICLFVVSKSWEIVNGFFEVSAWATNAISSLVFSGDGVEALTVDMFDLPSYTEADEYQEIFGSIFSGIGSGIICMISSIALCIITLYIRMICYVWIFELLMYAAGSPIPFSSFINKEWSQMGQNYIRKLLSLSFQGVFMLLSLTIYSVVNAALISGGSGRIGTIGSMAGSVMAAAAVTTIIKKSGTITDSVFNAH